MYLQNICNAKFHYRKSWQHQTSAPTYSTVAANQDFATTVVTKSIRKSALCTERGVLQGDCLSPLIFNLLINTFIQYVRQERLSKSGNESVKFLYHESNISSNIHYSYKSCKDVLKDIRDSKINKMLTNSLSQSLIVKSLWDESFNENIKHWYTSFQNLPKNIYNFSTRYINNTLPTLRNMTMWKKTSTNLCKFCLNSQTLQHVVSGCKVYLHEGRYKLVS